LVRSFGNALWHANHPKGTSRGIATDASPVVGQGGVWKDQMQVLNEAGATAKVARPEMLGKTITSLLSADRTAIMAHAGWDVTTRGATVLETLVQIVRETLEQKAS